MRRLIAGQTMIPIGNRPSGQSLIKGSVSTQRSALDFPVVRTRASAHRRNETCWMRDAVKRPPAKALAHYLYLRHAQVRLTDDPSCSRRSLGLWDPETGPR